MRHFTKKCCLAAGVALALWATNSPLALAGHKPHRAPAGFEYYLDTVAKVQSQGRDDDLVKIRGRLTNYLYEDRYEFTDEAGNSIEVELDDDANWSLVHKNQLIEIFGEVERNMFRVKVEAQDFKILEEPNIGYPKRERGEPTPYNPNNAASPYPMQTAMAPKGAPVAPNAQGAVPPVAPPVAPNVNSAPLPNGVAPSSADNISGTNNVVVANNTDANAMPQANAQNVVAGSSSPASSNDVAVASAFSSAKDVATNAPVPPQMPSMPVPPVPPAPTVAKVSHDNALASSGVENPPEKFVKEHLSAAAAQMAAAQQSLNNLSNDMPKNMDAVSNALQEVKATNDPAVGDMKLLHNVTSEPSATDNTKEKSLHDLQSSVKLNPSQALGLSHMNNVASGSQEIQISVLSHPYVNRGLTRGTNSKLDETIYREIEVIQNTVSKNLDNGSLGSGAYNSRTSDKNSGSLDADLKSKAPSSFVFTRNLTYEVADDFLDNMHAYVR